jgi:protoporphyrinogen IX oxidase
MDYLLILALHVTAVSVWIITVVMTSTILAAFADVSMTPRQTAIVVNMGKLNRWVTVPAMVLTWLLGLTLAVQGAWFGAGWLTAKLVFVVALSGITGMVTRSLRQLSRSKEKRISWVARLSPLLILFAVLTITWLAITKPI